jgi:hypothetical protein
VSGWDAEDHARAAVSLGADSCSPASPDLSLPPGAAK